MTVGRSRIKAMWLMFALLLLTCSTYAADLHDPSGSFTGLLDLIRSNAENWDDKLRTYATTLFWLLAGIQFVWQFFPLVFRQADFGEIMGELIRFVMTTGFFLALLTYSSVWAADVVNSFRQAAASAAGLGSTGMRPGDMFAVAVDLANTVGNVETWNPLTATMIAFSALLVLVCFVFIAAFMAVTVVESYIIINAAVLFMGFGGSQWTREYALAIVRYAVSVGAKLFVLTLIVGLIVTSSKQWAAAYQNDDASMWTMVGLAVLCAILAKTIPEIVAGVISGSSAGGGSSIGGLAAAGAAGAAAAISVMTAGAAAPAAAAAAGEVAGGGAAAAGGGGLAGAINSSFAGASGGAGAAPAAGAAGAATGGASSGVGASTGGSAASKSAGVKTGGSSLGGAGNNPGSSAMKQAAKQASGGGSEDSKKGESQPQANNSGAQQAQPEQAQATTPNAAKPAGGASGRDIASAVTRSMGVLSAMAVPGMETAAGLSIGDGAPQPVPGQDNSQQPDMAPSSQPQQPENIIRPADPAPDSKPNKGETE
ncbi:P-type conjugative transfer protein TrbL [Salmonella enterica subsp. enterica serovar Enteritidis]|nr:P-type conjugative transfer protein TrbL [Salmonella enterica subsp. enterica serovar Enteritidis]HAO0780912.1 P-type conjugative transfer protein TrbL [Escherichia coli]